MTTSIGGFSVHNIDCPTALSTFGANAASCRFEVSFVPTTSGPIMKTLSFTDTGGPTATLSLTGAGVPPATTGQQAAAIKKCKKKYRKGSVKRKKCLTRARKLPV